MPSLLKRIKATGELRVITRLDPTTYFPLSGEITGLEFDLMTLFAQHLDVSVRFIVCRTFQELLDKALSGKADIIAAGLPISKVLENKLRFATSYQEVFEQLIYMGNRLKPESTTDLNRGILEVSKGSHHEALLLNFKSREPALTWETNNQLGSISLIYLVNQGLIDYTIADSNQVSLISRYLPKLHVAFDFEKPQRLAWALQRSEDVSLYKEVVRFFNRIKKTGQLKQILDRYYGEISQLNYFEHYSFRQDVLLRLPKYRQQYQQTGKKYGLDWRLLAAVGYQESHWKSKATSTTGVRGLMMLTDVTAQQLGITDRMDPMASILGGAMYLDRIKRKIPERINEPDKTWLALAAYNIGFSHLEDARILTQEQQSSPDKWTEVKSRLILLEAKKWHQQTRNGFARGKEAVQYVNNIRAYYELLVWLTEQQKLEKLVLLPKAIATESFVRLISPVIIKAKTNDSTY